MLYKPSLIHTLSMRTIHTKALAALVLMASFSCNEKSTELQIEKSTEVTAKEILGNPAYLAISFEGYRERSRDIQPSVDQLKEDLKILSAMGIKLVRTYNVQLAHAATLLKAIQELSKEEEDFEMYVMLGAWMDCKNAWTDLEPDHGVESEQNAQEIARAVALANSYPEIVKILAVGNEAMVKWATSYFVQPDVILKWVNHLQALKAAGDLPKDLWITSSDDFSSWGGGDPSYHTEDLKKLAQAVDYISIHTYPYHNSHYNPDFWRVPLEESKLSPIEKVDQAMLRARDFAISQYDSVANYMKSIGVDKPIHIGETGWASLSDGFYGPQGSKAADEYKQALYYQHMRKWTNQKGISLFYFEAFNEQWKDAGNPIGSENHFGLFGLKGEAKYALWDLVDQGIFKGLTRDGNPIVKTYNGNKERLLQDVLAPPAH